jgi:hypothetical protein
MFEHTPKEGQSSLRKFILPALLAIILISVGYVYISHTGQSSVGEISGVLHEGAPGFNEYKDLVKLNNSRIQMGLNFNRKRVVMFSGEIENRGGRTVDVVELKIMYFNYEEHIDTVIKTPVRPGPYTKVIQPLTSGPYNFYIEEFPGRWKGGECEVSIHGFRFAEE